jgi:glyoxylase-like metal-dependent hydrolase (beta-lactamase superfamily II)
LTAVVSTPAAAGLTPYIAQQVAPGVHLLATPPDYLGAITGNVTVVEQSKGVAVIDSGQTAADGRRVVDYVRSLGRKPVTALVYTHWHGDHPQGGSEIRRAWPAVRIISTVRTAESLRGPTLNYVGLKPDAKFDALAAKNIRDLIALVDAELEKPEHDGPTRARYERMKAEATARMADWPGTHLALPTETFTDELLLDDAVRPIRLIHPGRANTDGDAIAWLPKERVVITGDIVVSPVPFGFGSFPGEWIAVLQRLKAMNFAVLVPGHGEPQRNAAYLDRLIATITDIRDQVTALAKAGKGLEEVKQAVNYDAERAVFADTPRRRRHFEAFWLNPMTVNAYMEAKGQPVVQGDEALYK